MEYECISGIQRDTIYSLICYYWSMNVYQVYKEIQYIHKSLEYECILGIQSDKYIHKSLEYECILGIQRDKYIKKSYILEV